MKRIKSLSESKNHTAVDLGDLDQINAYSYMHPKLGVEVKGKVFLKDPTGATGTEISFTTIPPGAELGYFHIHTKDEETYLILRGAGYYQVDEDVFPIREGSVVRVGPEGVRSLCNTSKEEMLYICIQSKENSLEEYTSADGKRVPHTARWK